MNAQLRTLCKACRLVRRIDDDIAGITAPGRAGDPRTLSQLLKLRRIADSAAREMAECVGQVGIDFYSNHHRTEEGRVA